MTSTIMIGTIIRPPFLYQHLHHQQHRDHHDRPPPRAHDADAADDDDDDHDHHGGREHDHADRDGQKALSRDQRGLLSYWYISACRS